MVVTCNTHGTYEHVHKTILRRKTWS